MTDSLLDSSICEISSSAALDDVEFPLTDPLAADEELWLARRLSSTLRGISKLLFRHPHGVALHLERLDSLAVGETTAGPTTGTRDQARRDLAELRSIWVEAEKDVREGRSPDASSLLRGSALLESHAVPPEMLIAWARLVVRRNARPRTPLLSWVPSELLEIALSSALERAERYRDALARPNVRLVLREVLRIRPTGFARADLFQEGFIGLQQACLRFDASVGVRFSTYAVHWIQRAVRGFFSQHGRLIRVPERVQSRLRRFDRGVESELGEHEAGRVRRLMHQTVSLASLTTSSDSSGSPVVLRGRGESVGEESYLGVSKVVEQALAGLTEREREVLVRRFGIDGGERVTLEALGERWCISRERVRQIEKEALSRLRNNSALHDAFDRVLEEGQGRLRYAV